ncbi:MAG: hypothetical protein AAFX06_26415 [Planctomycetota bacterium]
MSGNAFDELQARYVAGEPLSSEDASRLLCWLEDNPDRRSEMMADESIDNQLHCLARLHDEELAERFVNETIERAVTSNRDDVVPVVRAVEETRPRSFLSISIPVAICTVALVFVGVSMTWDSEPDRDPLDFGFAEIANANDLSWELIDEASRRLRVTSGTGEIHFDNGTVAGFSAPAVVDLKAPGRLFVQTGSVKINVPPAAIGFTVETPIARIVDYGTTFDVDVGDEGRTATRVRSGIVTFESLPMSLTGADPITLTADGLNRASASASDLTKGVRSVATTASGSRGQFFGTIYAGGKTMEFSSRQSFEEFRKRFRSSMEQDPSSFHEQWEVIETTANGTSTMVESRGGTGNFQGSAAGKAQEKLIEHLRSMQKKHQGNAQMQQLLEGMIEQVEAVQGKMSD